MSVYVYKTAINRSDVNGDALFEVGMVVASSVFELFWNIDESLDPYSVVFKKYVGRSTVLSIMCHEVEDEEESEVVDQWLTPTATEHSFSSGVMGDSLSAFVADIVGWRRFVSEGRSKACSGLLESETNE